MCHEVPKREIKMGEIEKNWQPAKFYCSEIKLIYSTCDSGTVNFHRKNIDTVKNLETVTLDWSVGCC